MFQILLICIKKICRRLKTLLFVDSLTSEAEKKLDYLNVCDTYKLM